MSVAAYNTGRLKEGNMVLALPYVKENARNLSLAACQAFVTAVVIAVLQATHL